MKVMNIDNPEKFFEVINQCKGTVELVTTEGDRLNLKSQLTKYVALTKLFADNAIPEMELVAHDPEDVKTARAHGDLSENFEYHAAKKVKNQNESRIRYLERMIRTAVIVSDESAEDEVGMNNTVEVFFEEDNLTETYKLVTTVRGNSLEGLISTESPLGKALLGHKVGDRVYVEMANGAGYYVVVKSIENTTDDGTDKIRSF